MTLFGCLTKQNVGIHNLALSRELRKKKGQVVLSSLVSIKRPFSTALQSTFYDFLKPNSAV